MASSSESTMRSSSHNDLALATAVGIGIGMVAGTLLTRHLPLTFLSKPSSSSSSRRSLASRPAYTPKQTPPTPYKNKKITFDPSKLTSSYNLMISTVTPRPIALVASRHPVSSIDNIAPFSYFGCLAHDPPVLAIGFCRNRNASQKDSLENIVASKEFSVQIISEWYLDAANHSCGAFPPQVDEFVESGMTKAPCHDIQAPRVEQAGVSYECRLLHVHPLTNHHHNTPTSEIVLAEVVKVHVEEGLLVEGYDPLKPVVDTEKLRPVGRLGGNLYTGLGEIVEIPRPQV